MLQYEFIMKKTETLPSELLFRAK